LLGLSAAAIASMVVLARAEHEAKDESVRNSPRKTSARRQMRTFNARRTLDPGG